MIYDYIIVGGGSSGAVLANRLSASGAHSVLLLEAGRDIKEGEVPEDIADSYPGYAMLNQGYLWSDIRVSTDVVSHNNRDETRPLRRYEQARVLGGGSSINGQFANRGLPQDFEEWVSRGAAGWGWEDVLPYYKRLENDLDFHNEMHGNDGPIAIRRIDRSDWSDFSKSVASALSKNGLQYVDDQNGTFEDGYFAIPTSNNADRRVTTATAYLPASVRRRANLEVRTDTVVSNLLMSDLRCVGVTLQRGPDTEEVRGREVILATGAINTPPLLLRAGVGPGADLQALGIPVRVHRAGVGQRLMEHPAIGVVAYMRRSARARVRRHVTLGWRYSSRLGDAPETDMFAFAVTRTAWHAVGQRLGSLMVAVNKSFSETGEVRLRSADWRDMPEINLSLLSDRRDLDRLMDGFKRNARIVMSEGMKIAATDAFPATFSDRVRQVGQLTPKNKALTNVAGVMLDSSPWVRSWMIQNFVMEGASLREMMSSDDILEAFIRKSVMTFFHPCCSCRMGSESDPLAVVDPRSGRVHGVEGLRIIDASIFPVIPRANTNLPTIMAAEKLSDAILQAA